MCLSPYEAVTDECNKVVQHEEEGGENVTPCRGTQLGGGL